MSRSRISRMLQSMHENIHTQITQNILSYHDKCMSSLYRRNKRRPCFTCTASFKPTHPNQIYCHNPCDSNNAHRLKFNVRAIIKDHTERG